MGGASLSTASAMGRMLLTTMAGFAELERNLVSERTTTSLTYKRLHREVFNHAPYGFEIVGKTLVENADEIAVVNLIRERREDGWTLGMIASALNDDRVPTKLNGRWYARTIKNILDSDIYDHHLRSRE
jgi:DNA invertase Pin-like site-specific DNA recombinase